MTEVEDVGGPPEPVGYAPLANHPDLPVEVVQRSDVMMRREQHRHALRQRSGFHQMILGTRDHGTHIVDFEPIEISVGTLVRIHPGQVQEFVPDPPFEAAMVIWPNESHPIDPDAPSWYPGGAPSHWQLDPQVMERLLARVTEIKHAQREYDGSTPHRRRIEALLSALVWQMAIDLPDTGPSESRLPRAYLDYRAALEQRLYERPTVANLASAIGYSTRTIDRACAEVTGQTARQVLDERTALEIKRLLTHSDRQIVRIAADFGFGDPSNFSKFVRRHLGERPGDIRAGHR